MGYTPPSGDSVQLEIESPFTPFSGDNIQLDIHPITAKYIYESLSLVDTNIPPFSKELIVFDSSNLADVAARYHIVFDGVSLLEKVIDRAFTLKDFTALQEIAWLAGKEFKVADDSSLSDRVAERRLQSFDSVLLVDGIAPDEFVDVFDSFGITDKWIKGVEVKDEAVIAEATTFPLKELAVKDTAFMTDMPKDIMVSLGVTDSMTIMDLKPHLYLVIPDSMSMEDKTAVWKFVTDSLQLTESMVHKWRVIIINIP